MQILQLFLKYFLTKINYTEETILVFGVGKKQNNPKFD